MLKPMHVPVLAYHAVNINGNEYDTNDHVAFAADLRMIDDLGLRIVPLHWLVDQLLGRAHRDLDRCVVLTCDDGSDFDFRDLEHAQHGHQRSLLNCMKDFIAERGADAQPDIHLTVFAIASPEARAEIDRGCLVNQGWMNESWWPEAQATGLISIENHSWDHNHPAVQLPLIDGMPRGSFLDVNNHIRATVEIADATRYINARIAPQRTTIFCYPFSHVPNFLHDVYLPNFQHEHGMEAAMGDGATPVTMQSDRWNLPRYICGWHWKSPTALREILTSSS
jgi:peptidoglycan/xylan/chitin deacetylase (PgdA/CDA1 family)